jgi:hypothetical protein
MTECIKEGEMATLKTNQKNQKEVLDYLLENQNSLTNFQTAIFGVVMFALGSSITFIGFLVGA